MRPHILRWSAGMGLALLGSTWASPVLAQTQPSLVINDVTVSETGAPAIFSVSLSGTHGAVTVSFATSSTGGTATAGTSCGGPLDFMSVPSGSLSFLPTENLKQISIPVCDDTRDEFDETFFVNLSNASGATIQDPQGQATILDNDPPPSLFIGDVTVTEGPPGGTATFVVALSAVSGKPVTVAAFTGNGTAMGGTCGVVGVDFLHIGRAVPISPGQTVGMFVVSLCDDPVHEGNEAFQVDLSPVNLTNATIQDGVGVGTIVDDEPLPALSIVAAVQAAEGTSAAFTVTLGGPPTAQTVSVTFATAPGTAKAGNTCGINLLGLISGDYITQTGTVSFAPGVTAQQILVPICVDRIADPNETFTVTLSNPVNATITRATGTATIP